MGNNAVRFSSCDDGDFHSFIVSLFDSNVVGDDDTPILNEMGRLLSAHSVADILAEALLRRKNEAVTVGAIDLALARSDVDVDDIVLAAVGLDRTSTEDINFLDLIHKRLKTAPMPSLLVFLGHNKADLVRQTAARLIVLHNQDCSSELLERYYNEADDIVKLNLCAALFRSTGRQEFLYYIQNLKRSLRLDLAVEARECEGLALFGDPQATLPR